MTSLGFAGITQMQEMRTSICHSAQYGEEGQLIDIRDSKTYWVARLNDGNCWMTQNLDLDIPAAGLSANDTDIEADWNSSSASNPVATQTEANPNFTSTYNAVQSWDPAQGGKDKYCISNKCDNLSATSSNNGHDAQGNYYSWGAATAGQASSLISSGSGEQATQSICPKGWRLPLSGISTNSVLLNANKTFAYLFEGYGWIWNKGSYASNLNGGTKYTITDKPFYFVYSGLVAGSSLGNAGNNGYYWSSTAYSGTQVYSLNFNTGVNPSNTISRYYGSSVRCVAR